jgi:hypothetical protein
MKYLLLVLLSVPAFAGTITNVVTHPERAVHWSHRDAALNWSETATIPGFDVPGATLLEVTVVISETIQAEVSGENKSRSAVDESVSVSIMPSFVVLGNVVDTSSSSSNGETVPAHSKFSIPLDAASASTYSLPVAGFQTPDAIPVVLANAGSGDASGSHVRGTIRYGVSAIVIYTYR